MASGTKLETMEEELKENECLCCMNKIPRTWIIFVVVTVVVIIVTTTVTLVVTIGLLLRHVLPCIIQRIARVIMELDIMRTRVPLLSVRPIQGGTQVRARQEQELVYQTH
jgi:hypothetical protein